MTRHRNKGARELARMAEAEGYSVTLTARGHLLCQKPGARVTLPSDPATPRHYQNALAQLRRGASARVGQG